MKDLKFDKKRRRVVECPCGKSNKDGKFAPYVGYDNKGYCHSCGQTFLPKLGKEEWEKKQHENEKVSDAPQPIDFIPRQLLAIQRTQGNYLNKQNHLFRWLQSSARGECAFDTATVAALIEQYQLATTSKQKGYVLFPYIDLESNIRNLKAMNYDPTTGKRIHDHFAIRFLGKKLLKNEEANLVLCFFGEHLLQGNMKPVMLFESEATAIYASVFYPDYICLATGGKNGCKFLQWEVCKVLQGRKVILYPDIDAHTEWEEKAEKLRYYGIDVSVSTLIKDTALRFAADNDIDYQALVAAKFDLRDILQYKSPQKLKVKTKADAYSSLKADGKIIANPIKTNFSSKKQRFVTFEQYVTTLYIEDGILMTDGYPATWDLFDDRLDKKTKNFIKLAEQNPNVLGLVNCLGLAL